MATLKFTCKSVAIRKPHIRKNCAIETKKRPYFGLCDRAIESILLFHTFSPFVLLRHHTCWQLAAFFFGSFLPIDSCRPRNVSNMLSMIFRLKTEFYHFLVIAEQTIVDFKPCHIVILYVMSRFRAYQCKIFF